MKLRFGHAELKSGDTIHFSQGVTAVVGPNNVGKSALLNTLIGWDGYNFSGNPLCSGVHLDHEEDVAKVLAWCEQHLHQSKPDHEMGFFTSGNEINFLSEQEIRNMWSPSHSVNPQYWLLYLSVERRAELTGRKPTYDRLSENPQSALQRLWGDPALEKRLSQLVKDAFGRPITVRREGGPATSLHLGDPGVAPYPDTMDYLQRMSELPEVHSQGHGLRSLVGMLLEIIAGTQRILLIDEPETFLHPPQARHLGRMLSEFRQSGMQIILATHSTDILQGLVDGQTDPDSLTIVRLTRSGDSNFASPIAPETISGISRDPLLRHSLILDGLFYHGTVLCEADGDATFYAAVNAHIAQDGSEDGQALDLLFTHTNGGYARLPKAVKALISAKVPVVSVLDLDVLGNVEVMVKLLDAYGTSIEALGLTGLFSQVRNHVQQMATDPTRKQFLNAVEPMRNRKDNHLTADELSELKPLLETRTGWKQLKSLGVQGVTGPTGEALDHIVAKLKGVGIFIVPVGELERFETRAQQRPKSVWLEHVLTNRFDESAGEHRSFINDIRSFVRHHQDW